MAEKDIKRQGGQPMDPSKQRDVPRKGVENMPREDIPHEKTPITENPDLSENVPERQSGNVPADEE